MVPNRSFFRRHLGRAHLKACKKKYGLDKCLVTGLKPCFIDYDEIFNPEYGSKESFLQHLDALYEPIIDLFVSLKLDLDLFLSEEFVRTYLYSDVQMVGQIDFIYNKYHSGRSRFNSIGKLNDQYVILDGKYNISSFSKREQLEFYAAMLYFEYKKVPSKICFINWSKAELKSWKFKLSYIDHLKRNVVRMMDRAYHIVQYFNRHEKNTPVEFDVEELPKLEFEASQSNCLFCLVKESCPASISKGLDKTDHINLMRRCRQTRNQVKDQLDPNVPVRDITI
jgi:hypothetical protein